MLPSLSPPASPVCEGLLDFDASRELAPEIGGSRYVHLERPAAGLRQAQLELRAQRRFDQPYFWAAFELQGDWR
jgi:hypothetical protein